MTASSADLAIYVGLPSATTTVQNCWFQATALVDKYIEGLTVTSVPIEGVVTIPREVVDRARIEVGAELFHRKNTKNAVAQFATPDGNPVRIARDPMVAAYPLLRPYVGGGFA